MEKLNEGKNGKEFEVESLILKGVNGKKRNEKGVVGEDEVTRKENRGERKVYQRVAESQKVISTEENVVPAKAESQKVISPER